MKAPVVMEPGQDAGMPYCACLTFCFNSSPDLAKSSDAGSMTSSAGYAKPIPALQDIKAANILLDRPGAEFLAGYGSV